MTTATEEGRGGSEALGRDGARPVLAEGESTLPASKYGPDCVNGDWRVVVTVREHLISRSVWYNKGAWLPAEPSGPLEGQHFSEVIWPTWPASLAEEKATSPSPLKDLQQHWDEAISRLRDSAKWMSAVLGAALASVIPTAPLTGLGKGQTSTATAVLGVAGLLFLSITMLLILQVMRPSSVSYADIQGAEAPGGLRGALHNLVCTRWARSHAFESSLYRWQRTISDHPDLYLPCGVKSLVALRQLTTVEELTLVALSRARENASVEAAHTNLGHAQAARAARLYELRSAAATIVSVGMFYNARARSTVATYGGVTFGFLGLVAIVAAVAWPIH
jgi:hypothetical protein